MFHPEPEYPDDKEKRSGLASAPKGKNPAFFAGHTTEKPRAWSLSTVAMVLSPKEWVMR